MSDQNQHSIGDAIKQMLKRNQLDQKYAEFKATHAWEKLMGGMIAKHTKKLYISNHKLYIQVDSAALREELTYSKEKIIRLVNEEAGAEVVREVVIR
jgi:predicted nucleic acid-binding Zn ribbon protein